MLWGLHLGAPLLYKKQRKEIIHNMALIDEYKQAIQDVLDGRAKEAPRPSELPWTEDKLAAMWAAAAAELIAEGNAGGGGADEFVITFASTTDGAESDVMQSEIYEAIEAGKQIVIVAGTKREQVLSWQKSSGVYQTILSSAYRIPFAWESSSSSHATLYNRVSGALVITDSSGTLDKKWNNIYDAVSGGSGAYIIKGGDASAVVACYGGGSEYFVKTAGAGSVAETYKATQFTGYPVAQS